MRESRYVLHDDRITICPKCKKPVILLCRKDGFPFSKSVPWFYICFRCEIVTELGRGKVDDERGESR